MSALSQAGLWPQAGQSPFALGVMAFLFLCVPQHCDWAMGPFKQRLSLFILLSEAKYWWGKNWATLIWTGEYEWEPLQLIHSWVREGLSNDQLPFQKLVYHLLATRVLSLTKKMRIPWSLLRFVVSTEENKVTMSVLYMPYTFPWIPSYNSNTGPS